MGRRLDRGVDRAVTAALLDQSGEALEPIPVRRLDEGTQLVVEAQDCSRPVPEARGGSANGFLRVDAYEERLLDA